LPSQEVFGCERFDSVGHDRKKERGLYRSFLEHCRLTGPLDEAAERILATAEEDANDPKRGIGSETIQGLPVALLRDAGIEIISGRAQQMAEDDEVPDRQCVDTPSNV